MGERLLCKQEVIGSIPFTSTTGRGGRGAPWLCRAARLQGSTIAGGVWRRKRFWRCGQAREAGLIEG